jgi:hypothetical protein
VIAPAPGTEVHLDIPTKRRLLAKLEDRTAKIRPALDVSKTRMKNSQRPTVQGLQLIAQQPLMLPNGLQ